MVAFMLESLVLRGSVLSDVRVVGLRLGTGLKVDPRTPGIRNSRRHPAPSCRQPDTQPAAGPEVGYPTSGAMPGAGRSRRQLGSPMLPGAARITRRTALSRTTFGGTTSSGRGKSSVHSGRPRRVRQRGNNPPSRGPAERKPFRGQTFLNRGLRQSARQAQLAQASGPYAAGQHAGKRRPVAVATPRFGGKPMLNPEPMGMV